jgi:hypothetical protein
MLTKGKFGQSTEANLHINQKKTEAMTPQLITKQEKYTFLPENRKRN